MCRAHARRKVPATKGPRRAEHGGVWGAAGSCQGGAGQHNAEIIVALLASLLACPDSEP